MKTELRKVTEKDYEFAFEVKKDAMGPHIESKWGWDEEYQLSVHRQRWAEKPWYIILYNDEPIGTVSIADVKNGKKFGEFYLKKAFRNKGIGTKILEEFLEECDKNSETVILEYLKWNPVGTLYKRHGFKINRENDIHYFLSREPKAH